MKRFGFVLAVCGVLVLGACSAPTEAVSSSAASGTPTIETSVGDFVAVECGDGLEDKDPAPVPTCFEYRGSVRFVDVLSQFAAMQAEALGGSHVANADSCLRTNVPEQPLACFAVVVIPSDGSKIASIQATPMLTDVQYEQIDAGEPPGEYTASFLVQVGECTLPLLGSECVRAGVTA